MTTREAFEEWVGKGLHLERIPTGAPFAGDYRNIVMQTRWDAWQAATAAAPTWHDAPTVPGLWVSTFSWMAQKLGRETVEFYAKNRSIPSRRWYGPMPEDKP